MAGREGGGGSQILETLRWFFIVLPEPNPSASIRYNYKKLIMFRGRKAFSPLNTPKTNA